MDLVYEPAWPHLLCMPLSLGSPLTQLLGFLKNLHHEGGFPRCKCELNYPNFINESNNPLFHIIKAPRKVDCVDSKSVHGFLDISEEACHRERGI